MNWEWAIQGNAEKTGSGNSIALDKDGNIYVTGNIKNNNTENLFVSKLDENGNRIWAKQAGGRNNGVDIVVDTLGNTYVIGNGLSNSSFDSIYIDCSMCGHLFVGKLDADGEWVWIKHAEANLDISTRGRSITIDKYNNLCILGRFGGNISFGDKELNHSYYRKGGVVAKLDLNGNWLWASQAGQFSSSMFPSAITSDNDGNYYITGGFEDGLIISKDTLKSYGHSKSAVFVAKLDSDGNWLWAIQSGISSWGEFCGGRDITTDEEGNVYIVGNFYDTISFGNDTLEALFENSRQVFICKLDKNGRWIWAKKAKNYTKLNGNSIIADDGNVYVCGNYKEMLVFDNDTIFSNGNNDIFIAKLNAEDGKFLWLKNIGGTLSDSGNGIVMDNDKSLYLAGQFGGSLLLNNSLLEAKEYNDFFVAKLKGSNTETIARSNKVNYSFAVYPNPASDYIYVHSNEFRDEIKVELVSILGKRIVSSEVKRNHSIPVNDYPRGVYVIRIISDNNVIGTKKIILK